MGPWKTCTVLSLVVALPFVNNKFISMAMENGGEIMENGGEIVESPSPFPPGRS
jgi:hypothetical protein